MIPILCHALTTIDANEQAQRAADAAWESARWAFCLFVLTVVLAAGAIVASYYAKKTWDAAKKAEREREANNVAAWLQLAKGGRDVEVYVRNGNGGPVFDVKCRVFAKRTNQALPTDKVRTDYYVAFAPYDPDRVVKYAFNMGSNEYVFSHEDPKSGTRYTRNGTTNVVFDTEDEWKIWDSQLATDGLAVDLSFRDSAGRTWKRDWHGRLTEVD
ncbi:hypothetical protein SAMN05660916_02341 [Arthrobacter sp. 31Cvi3.1E]|nr:hypothetical protein SAMN05660916_02341 [Arthrobacter sp. 31Cvi3.1E]